MTQEHPPMPDQQLIDMLLALVPVDGSTVGNTALKRALDEMLKAEGKQLNEDDYWRVQASLVASSTLSKGQGRGGSVRRTDITAPSSHLNALTDGKDSFVLEAQDKPVTAEIHKVYAVENQRQLYDEILVKKLHKSLLIATLTSG